MPPFCPPQILFRLILGLLPVLSKKWFQFNWLFILCFIAGTAPWTLACRKNWTKSHFMRIFSESLSQTQSCYYVVSQHGEISHTVSGLQSTCGCRYHCLQALRGHCRRSKPQPVWWHDRGNPSTRRRRPQQAFTSGGLCIKRRVGSLYSYLLPAVYPVPPQDRRAAGRDPHSR